MVLDAAALVEALGGLAGAVPPTGVLQVVAVPRFDPSTTSLRAALAVAAADEIRRPAELPPDVLGPLVTGEVVDGTIHDLTLDQLRLERRRVVQLVASASQTSTGVVGAIRRLHGLGVPLEVVASTSERDAALVAAGVAGGVARSAGDPALERLVIAADRPDLRAWAGELARRGVLGHTLVTVIARAGTPGQSTRRIQLSALAEEPVAGPVTIVVGDEEEPVGWRARLPLRGVVVANLRASHQAPALTARLRDLGAAVVEAPLLDIVEGDAPALAAVVRRCRAGEVDTICLTSPNGVRALAAAIERAGTDARVLAGIQVACVGPGTAATLQRCLAVRADLVAEVHTTVGLAASLGRPPRPGAVAVLPRADRATDELRSALAAAGWTVEEVDAYRTVTRDLAPAVASSLAAGGVHLVPVLSSSMADAVVAAGRDRGVVAGFVSIGPVTSATLRAHGVEPVAEADPHDLDGLVAAIVAAANGHPGRSGRTAPNGHSTQR